MNSSSPRTLQTVILVLVVVGLMALALGGYLTPLTRIAMNPLVSAQTWLATRYQAIQNYINAPQDLTRLRQENATLKAENARLEAQIIELEQQMAETRVLSALLGYAQQNPENQVLAAAVIGRDTNPFMKYIIINRGSDHGLRRGMPVVTQQGLVGRVTAVMPGAARVQLITDSASLVNVRIEGSGAQSILKGQINAEVVLDAIPQSAEVQPGDLILTSGLGGNYPANILVGQITGVRSLDFDIFQRASVQPIVDFANLEIVLVITNFRPIDISPLIPTPGAP